MVAYQIRSEDSNDIVLTIKILSILCHLLRCLRIPLRQIPPYEILYNA